ncbi:MAG: acetyl-CoA carboxylase biotin carboxyl carrier protein subunit [Bacteroidales bacterium]|jgi:biotin carboxyl carrier protein
MENEEKQEEQKEEKPEFQKFILNGDQYKTLFTKKYLSRKPYIENDPGKIVSFIPGTIIKVFVSNGQVVKKDEKLLILEAMKMHNVIMAPMNGKIKKLHVSDGDKVANKQLLIEITEEGTKETKEKKKKAEKKISVSIKNKKDRFKK